MKSILLGLLAIIKASIVNEGFQVTSDRILTVLIPETPDMGERLFVGKARLFRGYGSSILPARSCCLLTMDAATIAKVVRTAPMPHENTTDVFRGSVALMIRTYASR
jgi:hypothetical protein